MFEVNSPGNDPERARAPRQEGGGRHVAEAGDQSGILTGGWGGRGRNEISTNFERLVLPCTEADFCKQILVVLHIRWKALDEMY